VQFRLPPSRGHGFDNSKHNKAKPEVDYHPQIDLERRMMCPRRKIFLQQEIDRIARKHSHKSVEKIGG
jgi:hypothetical protein